MAVLTFDELKNLVARILHAHGMTSGNAALVADVIARAERDGSHSHGLFRIDGYLATLASGKVDGAAVPQIEDAAPGAVRVDAANGFAQPALEAGRPLLIEKARRNGVALLLLRNSHHFAALWPDVEPLAEEGLIALAFVNSRPRLAPWDAARKLLGTNPMAFACPRSDGPPLVWDQASSVIAQGDALLAAKAGRELEDNMVIDANGAPSRDPNVLLEGGALRAFGGHKGSGIALMVEILAATLGGGIFGFEDTASEHAGAATQSAGETVIAICPKALGAPDLAERVATLLEYLRQGGVSRFPSEGRYKRRASHSAGIEIADDRLKSLERLAQAR